MKKFLIALSVLVMTACGGGSSSPSPDATHSFIMVRTPAHMTWSNANNYCKTTVFNGTSGWRLPTQPELTAYAQKGLDTVGGGGGVWSSTPGTPTYHYWVSLNNTTGTAELSADFNYLYVRCAHD